MRSHILIYNKKFGYLVLLKNKIKKGIYHQLLSGRVEQNETYLQAIIREIHEELSIDITCNRITYLLNNNERTLYYLEL